jgi:hypothetical protein
MELRALVWALLYFAATIREKKEVGSTETDATRADLMMVEFDKRFPAEAITIDTKLPPGAAKAFADAIMEEIQRTPHLRK